MFSFSSSSIIIFIIHFFTSFSFMKIITAFFFKWNLKLWRHSVHLQLEQASLFCVIDNDIKLKTQNHFLFLFTFFLQQNKILITKNTYQSKEPFITFYFLFLLSLYKTVNFIIFYLLELMYIHIIDIFFSDWYFSL